MNQMRNFFLSLVIGVTVCGALAVSAELEATVEKQFVILKSTKSYKEARGVAEKSAETLKIKLDLRGLSENKELGLTFDKKVCEEEGGFEFPCYIARGRFDDGEYISIEYSSAYEGFSDGYYIVVVSSYPRGSEEIQATLRKVRTLYEDAYAKTSKVYVGCIH